MGGEGAEDGKRKKGQNPAMRGDCSFLRGECSGLWGGLEEITEQEERVRTLIRYMFALEDQIDEAMRNYAEMRGDSNNALSEFYLRKADRIAGILNHLQGENYETRE